VLWYYIYLSVNIRVQSPDNRERERVGVLRGGGVKQQEGNKGEITNWSNDKRLEATRELFNR
jgi:hypothetical protein